jgi:hypothetical protein
MGIPDATTTRIVKTETRFGGSMHKISSIGDNFKVLTGCCLGKKLR